MRIWHRHCAVSLLALLLGWGPGSVNADRQGLDEAKGHLDAGRPEAALTALARGGTPGSSAFAIEALLLRAEAERARGTYARAASALASARTLAQTDGTPATQIAVLTALGDLSLLIGNPAAAVAPLEEAVALARRNALGREEARAWLNLALARSTYGEPGATDEALAAALTAARRVDDWSTLAAANINVARLLPAGDGADAAAALREAVAAIPRVESPGRRLELLLSAGVEASRRSRQAGGEALAGEAHAALSQAAQEAAGLGNDRARSSALGYLGRLYEGQGRNDEALKLSTSALFLARAVQAGDLEYRWAWQLGRVHRALGDPATAIAYYQDAADLLAGIKDLLGTGRRDGRGGFLESVAPLYFELADLLLSEPDFSETAEVRQRRLRRARRTIEALKAAELEDHFADGCVTDLQARIKPLEDVDSGTAVLYHIAFEDRLEILVSSGGEMSTVQVPVGAGEIHAQVREMRLQLERTSVRAGFLRSAMRLHEVLIAPVEQMLLERGVETLVFVPYGEFLLIPPAALFDGRQFLIEKFAVAITPGLDLTDPQPLRREGVEILLAGMSEARPGFSALPHVVDEVARIEARFPGRSLIDGGFTSEAVAESLASQPYTILHFATHAQFDPDPARTFLLTYDGKLTIDQLDQLIRQGEFRDQPVELLTLSACETAAGDYKAALGLAGVGIKAGARSALASLWPVSDAASVALVDGFYELLRSEPSLSKAAALQQAQVQLLKQRAFAHPGYWSAFLLIGNWL